MPVISLDDLSQPKVAPKKAKPLTGGLSLDSIAPLVDDKPKISLVKKADNWLNEQIPKGSPTADFLSSTDKALKDTGKALLTDIPGLATGAVKGLVSGAVDLGEMAIQGVTGLANAALVVAGVTEGDGREVGKNIDKGMKSATAVTDKVNQLSSAITKINLAPANESQEAAHELLMILPNYIKAFGGANADVAQYAFKDTPYEAVAAGIAGAGTEALGTLLTFKPHIASEALTGVKKLVKGEEQSTLSKTAAEKVASTFDETVVKTPEVAEKIVEHVSKGDVEVGGVLKARMRFNEETQKWETKQTPEEIGKVAAEKDIAVTMEELAAKIDETPLASENGTSYKTYKQGDNTTFPELLPETPTSKVTPPLKGEFFKTLEEAQKQGKIAESDAALAKWFVEEGANVSKNVSRTINLEFAKQPEGVTARAFYYPAQRLIKVFGDDVVRPGGDSIVHEVLHHMERMLPLPLHREVRAMWARDLAEMSSKGTELQRRVAKAIHEYHKTGDEGALSSAKFDATLYAVELSGKRDAASLKRFQELYQLWNPSEYWAVNGARLMVKEYGLSKGAKGAIRRWGNAALDKIKNLLHLDKDSALMTAIRSVFNGKGEFVTNRMLGSRMEEIIRDTPEMTAAAAADLVGKGAAEFDSVLSLRKDKPLASEEFEATSGNRIDDAFKALGKGADKTPGIRLVKAKLELYLDQAIRTVNPGAKGKKAKIAESVLAEAFAQAAQEDSAFYHQAFDRGLYWERNKSLQTIFRDGFETGDTFSKNPELAAKAQAYKEWKDKMVLEDRKAGIYYAEKDNYLPHIFEDGPKIADFFQAKYGRAWGQPGYTKDRGFDLYKEAVAAGYKPKFTNPEDIMLARQHASTIAQMKVGIMRELEKAGLAFDKAFIKDSPDSSYTNTQSTPNGKTYWVHNEANLLLNNAFNTTSLWSMEGIGGDLFRGAMFLKNAIVPIELAFSLFHPLHVATIDNATAMTRASKLMLTGKMNPIRWTAEMAQASLYKELVVETGGQLATLFGAESRGGHRILQLWKGKIPSDKVTAMDRRSLQAVIEGGLIPEMSSQYRTKAIDNLKKAIAGNKASTAWHLPWAALEAFQKPMFEVWIPSLKTASYLRDVNTALKADPTLAFDNVRRRESFTKLRKSIDNRYGEMAYNTLFWNKWVKDFMVANSLSLGWNLGFIREYGGAVTDMTQTLKSLSDYKAQVKQLEKPSLRYDKEQSVWLPSSNSYIDQYIRDGNKPKTLTAGIMKQVRAGGLDRPLFVAFYSGQALLYGGLITYFMSSTDPEGMEDYLIPRTGEVGEDGKPVRLNTMFYPREFLAIQKHMEMDGVLGGLKTTVTNKAAPSIGVAEMWFTGENSMRQEIRNPNSPVWEQIMQTTNATLEEVVPISFEAIKGGDDPLLAFSGFNEAPAYMTQSKTEGAIKHAFIKYNAKKLTPFERANMSEERAELRKLYADDPKQEYDTKLSAFETKYELSATDIRRIEKDFDKNIPSTVRMFQALTWQQQKYLLDKMTDEEREIYLPVSNRTHLRLSYEAPSENSNDKE